MDNALRQYSRRSCYHERGAAISRVACEVVAVRAVIAVGCVGMTRVRAFRGRRLRCDVPVPIDLIDNKPARCKFPHVRRYGLEARGRKQGNHQAGYEASQTVVH